MKLLVLTFTLLVALSSWGAPLSKGAIQQVVVSVTDAFIPSGFDSKAQQMVVASGYFPNGCYSFHSTKVNHKNEFTHEVSVIANVQQGFCTMALIPYQQEIALGTLSSGQHKLIFPAADGTSFEKNFVIE